MSVKSTRELLRDVVQSLDRLEEAEAYVSGGNEGLLRYLERVTEDRRALVRLLNELEVKPDRLGRYGYTDDNFSGWAGKPVQALRAHLGLAEDPEPETRHENYRQREERIRRENHEKTAQYAQEIAEAWMNEAERRRKAGL